MIDGPHDWRSKKVCCCPLWSLALIFLMMPIVLLVFVLTSKFPINDTNSSLEGPGPNSNVGILEGLVIALLGVPAASGLGFAFQMCKNLIFSQDLNITKGMDNERISTQLGFMNDVRKEIWFLSRFIHFMEVFERRRIRVVLKITNLDRCAPTKIVAVLEAINILLSNEESPFISILAVNPEVLMRKINSADCGFSKQDRAHTLLNCIVTLAFTVPPLCNDSRRALFNSLVPIYKDRSTGRITQASRSIKKVISLAVPLVEISLGMQESYPLVEKTSALQEVKNEEVEMWITNIMTSNERSLTKYLSDDIMFMRRVFNSIRVTVIIMKALEIELPEPEHVAAWVVLANQWPCRLSWIIQCVEDAQQRADIDRRTSTDDSKTLWKVFSESKAELYVMSAHLEDLLQLDGDPELFERFLTVDFKFTIKDLKIYEVTVNLDHTIKAELAQIRGKSRLKDLGWMRNLAPLPITTIIKMATEDVCKEVRNF